MLMAEPPDLTLVLHRPIEVATQSRHSGGEGTERSKSRFNQGQFSLYNRRILKFEIVKPFIILLPDKSSLM